MFLAKSRHFPRCANDVIASRFSDVGPKGVPVCALLRNDSCFRCLGTFYRYIFGIVTFGCVRDAARYR